MTDILTHRRFKLSALLLSCVMPVAFAYAGNETLYSSKTQEAVILDGNIDDAWLQAKAITLEVDKLPYEANNYSGIKQTTVLLKSLYDSQHVYFLVQYADPTKSLARFPWKKQKDGSWKQLKDKDQTGHSNVYYEDKFAFFWDINARGFAKKGCAAACHLLNDAGKIAGIDQRGITAGRKYTRRAGETIDMWHWKSVRMNPVGLIDDQFVDHVKDPSVNKNWGRHGDSKTGGGYVNNTVKGKSLPAFMNRTQNGANDYTITPSQQTDFVDTFNPGDLVPGIVSTPFTGSRGDIWSRGVWKDGQWTIEIKRKLVTTGKNAAVQDVQFSDLEKTYDFGIAVFDNSQINHIYHDGSLKFNFK